MMSVSTLYDRPRYMGLAIGSLWLIVAGGVYGLWALIEVQTLTATSLLIAWCAATIALGVFAIRSMGQVVRLPPAPANPAVRRRMLRQFGITVAAEFTVGAVVAIMCQRTHHWILIVPLILVVVGLHFAPLARIFRVPRYYLMSALFCILPVGTMLYWPASAHVGHAYTWILVPVIGCGLTALLTGFAGVIEVQQSMRYFRKVAA